MSSFSLQICSRSPDLTRQQGPEWMAYKWPIDFIIFKLYKLLTHQPATMNSDNPKRFAIKRRDDSQMLAQASPVPATQHSRPELSAELKALMTAFSRRQVRLINNADQSIYSLTTLSTPRPLTRRASTPTSHLLHKTISTRGM